MADLYEGKPDARQAGDITPSRFRPQYRALTDEEKRLHDAIKQTAVELERLYGEVRGNPANRSGRYMALAVTELEASVMWAVKGLTS